MSLFCASGGRKNYNLPDGVKVEQVACTAGNETFLVEPLFRRLSIKDQALLLIHERLTTLRDKMGGKNYSAIARITTGLRIYLTLAREQSANQYRHLSDEEMNTLTNFYISVEELEKRDKELEPDSFAWTAHRYGGGRVHNTSFISANSLISLNSLVRAECQIGDEVTLINSRLENNVKIGSGTELNDVHVYMQAQIGENNKLKDLIVGQKVETGHTVEVRGVTLYDRSEIGERVKIEGTGASQFFVSRDVIVESSTFKDIVISIGANTEIKGSKFQRQKDYPGVLTIGEKGSILNTVMNFNDNKIRLGDRVKFVSSDLSISKSFSIKNDQTYRGVVVNDKALEYGPIGQAVKTFTYNRACEIDSVEYYMDGRDFGRENAQNTFRTEQGGLKINLSYYLKIAGGIVSSKKYKFSNCTLNISLVPELAPSNLHAPADDGTLKRAGASLGALDISYGRLMDLSKSASSPILNVLNQNGFYVRGDKLYFPTR